MKAIVQREYGGFDVLKLEEVPDPVPGPGEVLVRVKGSSVHADVWHMVTGRPYAMRLFGGGLRRPKNLIPGTDMAGVVEAVGPGASRFQVGDAVFGETVPMNQWTNGGAFAELVSVPEGTLERKPANLSFEEAAAVPTSALIALMNMRDGGKPQPGEKVLINGAGGAVGVYALQFAKDLGAEVTAVDHTSKLDLLRSLGADHVIDYTAENFTDRPERYDLLFDVACSFPYKEARRVLADEGRYIMIGHAGYEGEKKPIVGSLGSFFGLMARTPFDKNLPSLNFEMGKDDDLAFIARGLESGRFKAVVGTVFPMAEVREALECLVSGDFLGKIVLRIPA
ncbi:MAG: NAD(P)-dependent alcohol dehydrogenase [Deltaproteobacteria bacterium]|nr:NAD(P)-dependent alcohol dehydrogenase [Deltaproteobacteria bacterium]